MLCTILPNVPGIVESVKVDAIHSFCTPNLIRFPVTERVGPASHLFETRKHEGMAAESQLGCRKIGFVRYLVD